jgi:four helix bundle protein
VPSNIAEGSARGTKRDYLHFLHIARASLAETQYFCHLAKRLGILGEEDHMELESQIKATFARLHGLIKAVEKEAGKISSFLALIFSTITLTGAGLAAG